MTLFPDAHGIDQIKDTLRIRLHDSLSHLIFEAAAQQVPPALSPEQVRTLAGAEGHFPSAVVFAAHAALLAAAEADQSDVFARHSAALAALPASERHAAAGTAITPLADQSLSASAQHFLRQAFQDDQGLTDNLVAPEPEEVDRAAGMLNAAMQVLTDLTPDWGRDFTALVSQILLAVPGPENRLTFGGATTFDAFGAILVNARTLTTPDVAFMTLIHESSHQRLFLYHLDDPVLLNDAEARYASPLRKEPRPMEGLFHAAWVSARMAIAAEALLRSSGVPDWAEVLTAHKTRAIGAVRDSLPTIETHARMTPLGARLLADVLSSIAAL